MRTKLFLLLFFILLLLSCSSKENQSEEWPTTEVVGSFHYEVEIIELEQYSSISPNGPMLSVTSESSSVWENVPDAGLVAPEELILGRIVYNPPTEMIQGKTEIISVRISNDLTTDLEVGIFGNGEIRLSEIETGMVMSVDLNGSSFEIERMDGIRSQSVSDLTEWTFWVKPLVNGNHILSLDVYVETVMGDFGVVSSRKKVFRDDVLVNVSYLYFLKNNWQFLVGTLFGSGFLTGIVIWFFRKKT